MAKRKVASEPKAEASLTDEVATSSPEPKTENRAFSKADLFDSFYKKTTQEIEELHAISKQNMMNTHLTAKLALLRAQLEKIKELMNT